MCHRRSIDLTGWKIAGRLKKTCLLSSPIAPGATLIVPLIGEVWLGNEDGMITLLNAKGLKMDGVLGMMQQAQKEGLTIVC